jgi:hypothetical protein
MAKKGWFNESQRHRMASKGIKTGQKKVLKANKDYKMKEGDKVDFDLNDSYSSQMMHYKDWTYERQKPNNILFTYRGNLIEEEINEYFLIEDDGHRVLLVKTEFGKPYKRKEVENLIKKKIDILMDKPKDAPYLKEDFNNSYFHGKPSSKTVVSEESPKTYKPNKEVEYEGFKAGNTTKTSIKDAQGRRLWVVKHHDTGRSKIFTEEDNNTNLINLSRTDAKAVKSALSPKKK